MMKFVTLSATVCLLVAGVLVFGNLKEKPRDLGQLKFHLPIVSVKAKPLSSAECDPFPDPVIRLETQSRYSKGDKSKTIVDEAASAAYEKQIAPVRQFSRLVVGLANDFTITNGENLEPAYCAGKAIVAWANAEALSYTPTENAAFNKALFLASVSSAFLQVSQSNQISIADQEVVKNWLAQMARDTQIFYTKKRESKSLKPNNIQFWAAFAVANAAVATGDMPAFDWAMKGLELGVCAATDEGAIPREVDRKALALHYHLFALQPLISLAELASINGRQGYDVCEGKLTKIVNFTLDQLDDPALIQELSGSEQKPVGALKSNNDLAWLEIYVRHSPNFSWAGRMESLRPFSNTNMGGRLTELFGDPKTTQSITN